MQQVYIFRIMRFLRYASRLNAIQKVPSLVARRESRIHEKSLVRRYRGFERSTICLLQILVHTIRQLSKCFPHRHPISTSSYLRLIFVIPRRKCYSLTQQGLFLVFDKVNNYIALNLWLSFLDVTLKFAKSSGMFQVRIVVLNLHDLVFKNSLTIFYLNYHVLSLIQFLNQFIMTCFQLVMIYFLLEQRFPDLDFVLLIFVIIKLRLFHFQRLGFVLAIKLIVEHLLQLFVLASLLTQAFL